MEPGTYIAGVWSGHDCSYFILDHEGNPVVHNEYERFIREKEPKGDSIQFLRDHFEELENIKYIATCWPHSARTFNELDYGVRIGHHESHAVNAFYSSNLHDAKILTIDGGGIEDSEGTTCSLSIWEGRDTYMRNLKSFPTNVLNVGGVWTRVTRYVFGLQSGWPTGHQAGTVMAMAALGDPHRYYHDFFTMLADDHLQASMKPHDQPKGANTGNDPIHPYLNKYKLLAEQSDQNKYDLAAGMQAATEAFLKNVIDKYVIDKTTKNLCLSGGVVLNSVFTGKLWDWYPQLKNIWVTPTPHDGGLCIGAAQHVWHHVLGKPRTLWQDCFTPYLGKTYSGAEVNKALLDSDLQVKNEVSLDDVVSMLDKQKIVSFFSGGSESGRRALGNRSILADPRSADMKDKVNDKVKHRQWFRPFAPSILKSEVSNWFRKDIDSPYMSFCAKLKDKAKKEAPAISHFDGTARLQTVTKKPNETYYNLLSKWFKKTGCPILLNTSFNDREPICETPEHAVACFKNTEIDYLYFADHNILACK